MPTRSARLAASHPAAATATTLFTVPNGYTYLIKSVFVYENAPGGDTIIVNMSSPGVPAQIAGSLLAGSALASGGRMEWEGWAALNPGDSLVVYASLGLADFWVNGAKLPGVA